MTTPDERFARIAGELREHRDKLKTPKEIFDSLGSELCGYCDRPDVVIRIHMTIVNEQIGIEVIKHVRDPEKLFDNSRDVALSLSDDQRVTLEAKMQLFFELSQAWENPLRSATLSIYKDGKWSVGTSTQAKNPA